MFRIDSPGATVGGLFTEGNPTTGVPATEVSAEWLNDAVQEEIAGLVEFAGLTLVKTDNTQLRQAIQALIGIGGGSQIKVPIINNSGPNNVTGLVFDKLNFKAAIMLVDIHRQTDSSNVQEIGLIYATHDSKDDVWRISFSSVLDDSGMTFSITGTGQIQMTSNDLVGANYSGDIRVGAVFKFEQGA